jgi:hypothetical protein
MGLHKLPEPEPGPAPEPEAAVRIVWVGGLALALFLLGLSVGRAADRDEAVMTVQVSAADHEMVEGYFSLGENTTVMTKPGSDVYRFLSRQRGRKVRIVLTEAGGPELSRLQR